MPIPPWPVKYCRRLLLSDRRSEVRDSSSFDRIQGCTARIVVLLLDGPEGTVSHEQHRLAMRRVLRSCRTKPSG